MYHHVIVNHGWVWPHTVLVCNSASTFLGTCTVFVLSRLSSPLSFLSLLQLPATLDGRWWVERFGPGNPPSPAAVPVMALPTCRYSHQS